MNAVAGDASDVAPEPANVVPLHPHGRPQVAEESRAVDSFEEVFRRLSPRAVRVARRILTDDMLAEDAAAEAFARAHASWKRIAASGYCDAWILRVTANVAVDMVRKRERLSSATNRLASTSDHFMTEDDDPDDEATRDAIAAALGTLPRRQREVIVLRYLEGFTEEQVARALGVAEGTVKKNGFRARETLRRRLGRNV
jgi:RNA polymerase sigma factor (sigma-70 family)